MLLAAVNAKGDEYWKAHGSTAFEDVKWVIEKANNTMQDYRNDAIHAPCNLLIEGGEFQILPAAFFGHPRAKKLRGKALIKEFAWYELYADTLKFYARAVYVSVGQTPNPAAWPQRPLLPGLGQAESRMEVHLRTHAKVPPRRAKPPRP